MNPRCSDAAAKVKSFKHWRTILRSELIREELVFLIEEHRKDWALSLRWLLQARNFHRLVC